jgi:5-(carboxyamino)imidazole ribonucleotide synthase
MTMRLGTLGGGQLGRMLALAGAPLGVRTTVLDPSADPCASQVCGHVRGEYDDFQKLYDLAQASDVVTYEFENVPVETARWLAERVPVYPPPRALEVSQDRVVEKTFFQSLGIPTPAFAAIETRADFDMAIRDVGVPSVLKTRRFGYDGKGQTVLRTPVDVEPAWQLLGGRPLILEGFVPFDRELSLVAVRGRDGQIVTYPLVENEHREGMLYRTLAPARDTGEELTERAVEYVERILTELDYVGVLAVEWFQDGPRLVANEMAPRVHNSGHFTQDAAVTSQFENHVRAVMGLPLGSTAVPRPCVMFNLIGEKPNFADVLAIPGAKLHWYGKEPKAGRKVGHVTVAADTDAERDQLAERVATLL